MIIPENIDSAASNVERLSIGGDSRRIKAKIHRRLIFNL
jgi:hypothetical protein